MAELPRRGGDMLIKHNLRPEQAVEARDCLVDTLIQTNKQEINNILEGVPKKTSMGLKLTNHKKIHNFWPIVMKLRQLFLLMSRSK